MCTDNICSFCKLLGHGFPFCDVDANIPGQWWSCQLMVGYSERLPNKHLSGFQRSSLMGSLMKRFINGFYLKGNLIVLKVAT